MCEHDEVEEPSVDAYVYTARVPGAAHDAEKRGASVIAILEAQGEGESFDHAAFEARSGASG